MKIIITALVFVLIISCTNKQEVALEEKELNLVYATPLKVSVEDVLNPKALAVVNDMLFIYQNRLSEDIFTLVSTIDFTTKKRFGNVGDGPNEFSNIISMPVAIADKNELTIYDWAKKRATRYITSTDSLIKSGSSYVVPPELMLAQRAAFLNDSTLVFSSGTHKGLLGFVDIYSDSITYFNPFSEVDLDIPNRSLANIFTSEFAINFDKKLIAVASNYIPEIFLTDFNGNLVSSIKTEEYEIETIAEMDAMDLTIYYQDVSASNNYIYGVSINESHQELGDKIDNEDPFIEKTEIHIFDWESHLVSKLVLDQGYHPIVTIDPSNNRLYTIDRYSATNNILMYESLLIK